MKKPPSKVAQKYSKFFSPIAAKTAQTEEFMFQNVSYRPTLYRTGTKVSKEYIDYGLRIGGNKYTKWLLSLDDVCILYCRKNESELMKEECEQNCALWHLMQCI